MVAPVRPDQRHALVSVFVEFASLPDLLELLVRERGYRWYPGATRGYGWEPYGRGRPDDEPPGTWQDFFREHPPNVDHIHDDPFDYLWSGEPDLVRALCEDAWALVRRLRLVASGRLSRAGRTLAEIGMRERPDYRLVEDYAILRQTLARQVERLYIGAGRVPIVPVLRAAAVVLGQGGTRAAAHLPGLLAGEIAHLIDRARTDATEALIGAAPAGGDPRGGRAVARGAGSRRGAVVVPARPRRRGERAQPGGIAVADRGCLHPDAGPGHGAAPDLLRPPARGLSPGAGTMPGGRPVTPPGPPPVPVTLRNGEALPYDVPTRVIGLYLLHLLKHDFSANESFVFRKLGIDRDTRRDTGRDFDVETHDYRWMNKALAMELLTALLVSRIDSPARVDSQCLLDEDRGLPLTFAPARSADVIARYATGSGERTFGVVVEASAKRDMTPSYFETQLRQAIERGRELQAETGVPVYALVINGAEVASDADYAGSYRKMVHRYGIEDDPSLCLVAMDANDLGWAYCDLVAGPPGDRLHFRTEQLRGVLDALYAGLQQPEMLSKEDWMRTTWSSLGADGATRTLPLPGEEDGDEADAPVE